jgi:peptidoglycan/LPS O-acetylase OafA/YrhL
LHGGDLTVYRPDFHQPRANDFFCPSSMLGTLRLLLAVLVAVSHAGMHLRGLNPGVVAVIGFYLISGYVMAGLIRRHYAQPRGAPAFYLDRAIRLLPQYLFYVAITLAWHLYSRADNYFLSRFPSPLDILNNLAVVPLNYYMFNGSDRYTLIPPAWSLGAEAQFYLLAPLVLLWPKRLLAMGLLGLGVYGAALAGFLNSDWFGYRLLPGVLLFFLLGAYLQHLHHQQQRTRALGVTALVVALAALTIGLLHHNGTLRQPYNLETLLGLLLGIVALQLLATCARSDWDDLAGDLSYGVFLNHFLIIWVVYPQGIGAGQMPGFIALCIALSWVTQRYIERPMLQRRKALRRPPKP